MRAHLQLPTAGAGTSVRSSTKRIYEEPAVILAVIGRRLEAHEQPTTLNGAATELKP